MKDVIFWSVDAWQSVQSSTLRKAWCKFLGATFIEDNGKENVPNLNILFMKIPCCNEVTAEDTEEWVTGDDNEFGLNGNEFDLNDNDIAELVLRMTDDNDGDSEAVETETQTRINYEDAYSALEKSLMFIEEQPGVSAFDIITFRKWMDFAAERRLNTKNQSRITDFFLSRPTTLYKLLHIH